VVRNAQQKENYRELEMAAAPSEHLARSAREGHSLVALPVNNPG
jgi:hypothetical protein